MILRRVDALEGDVELDVTLRPHARFGRAPLRDVRMNDGVVTARTGGLRLRWQGAAGARRRDGALVVQPKLSEGP